MDPELRLENLSTMTKNPSQVRHPYIPASLHLPDFIQNTYDMDVLLGVFGSVVLLVLVAAWKLASKFRPDFTFVDKLKICWFSVSGLIHIVIEGYFARNYHSYSGSDDFLAQVWKEYAKGDSRYISSDAFTVVMESFTAFIDGPLCFWTIYAYIKNCSYVHVLQLLLSTAQFYGDILYMLTEWFEGFSHGPPYHPIYFWVYFVFMNSFWLIIPALLIAESACHISKAVRIANHFSNQDIKKTLDSIKQQKNKTV